MSNIISKIANSKCSRRQFLKASGIMAANMAAMSLVIHESAAAADKDGNDETTAAMQETLTSHSPIENPEEGGSWVTAACWHNCGGRCINKVMVKDGVVIRQKTDDYQTDSYDNPQQRACVRGRTQQQQCFGTDRIRYPMKRKNWEPVTGGNKELRGRDEWVRISWEEAFQYVADELKNCKENYGNRAFLVTGWGTKKACPVLNFIGGHTSDWDSTSYGTYVGIANYYGLPANGRDKANDRFDLLNSEMIILYAANPAWSAPGNPSFHFNRAKEAGIEFVVVGPEYNASAQQLDARWIRVRNGTDTAFLLAVAYEMIRMDEENGNFIDYDFLHTYCVGYDEESMPEGAKLDENFKDYVLGAYDNIPKTPEWASEICGTPIEDITWYAEQMAKDHKVAILHNFGAARNYGAENFPQMFMTVGAMGGHIGKSGHACGSTYAARSANSGPVLVSAGSNGLPGAANEIDDCIAGPQVWDAVLNGKYNFVGDAWYDGLKSGEERDIDIHVIFHDDSAYLQTGPNMSGGIKAHRKVDFVVSKAQFLTTNAKYSDIILPVTTEWERVGGFSSGNRELLVCYQQVVEPLFEAKTDKEIDKGIIEAMGLDPSELYPISEKQQFFNQIAGCSYLTEEGESQTLVTITQEDIDEWEVEGEPQEGIITIEELFKKGGYQVPRSEGDGYSYIGYKDFIDDPEGAPLPSESGKFEIYCQRKADLLNSMGFETRDIEYKPYPSYIVPETGYETTFEDGNIGGEKGEYPYLLFNPHYLRRSHSVFDNCPWLRETWPNPVFLSASDAQSKGIEDGDTVLVRTAYGQCLRKACLMETYMPGIVGIPHGAWVDIDEETGIDKAGADNYLLGPNISGLGVTGYNNCNCDFEKFEGESLPDDCDKPQNIFAFE